jgi:hypothetical protein
VIIKRAEEIPLVLGDYNLNGTVNANDYATWRENFGLSTNTSTSTGNAAADGNANGGVDLADYVTWRKAAGASGGSDLEQANVPEPTCVALVLLSGLTLPFYRRRVWATR